MLATSFSVLLPVLFVIGSGLLGRPHEAVRCRSDTRPERVCDKLIESGSRTVVGSRAGNASRRRETSADTCAMAPTRWASRPIKAVECGPRRTTSPRRIRQCSSSADLSYSRRRGQGLPEVSCVLALLDRMRALELSGPDNRNRQTHALGWQNLAPPLNELLMDRAGWHRAKDLVVPDNLTLVLLPARAP